MRALLLGVGSCGLLLASCKDTDEDERPVARASTLRAFGGPSGSSALQPTIDAQQAIAAAIVAVPGMAQEVRLESRAGKPEYEVLVQPKDASSRVRVDVDATSGKVTRTGSASSKDGDDDDDDERR